jgi:hypothetical protein
MVIIFLGLALTGFSAFEAYGRPRNTVQVLIQGVSRQWVFPLDTRETIAVPGPLGETIVRIEGNQAWVESSPCENQVCVAGGHIQHPGHWVACLPNNVFLMIEGSGGEGLGPDVSTW